MIDISDDINHMNSIIEGTNIGTRAAVDNLTIEVAALSQKITGFDYHANELIRATKEMKESMELTRQLWDERNHIIKILKENLSENLIAQLF
jgi:hypothetical protein